MQIMPLLSSSVNGFSDCVEQEETGGGGGGVFLALGLEETLFLIKVM
jgi:hypothetical protein